MLTKRLLVREEPPHETLVDQCNPWRLEPVRFGEVSSAQERDAERSEIAGRNGIVFGRGSLPFGHWRASKNLKGPVHGRTVIPTQEAIGNTGRLDARQLPDALEQFAQAHLGASIGRVHPGGEARNGKIQVCRDDVFGAKAAVGCEQFCEALQHESRANQQHDRQRDFSNYERTPRPSC